MAIQDTLFEKRENQKPSLSLPMKREKKARKAVLIADALADWTITVGGISVIVAVLGILVFLVAEVLPLFYRGAVTFQHTYRLEGSPQEPLGIFMDEHRTLAVFLSEQGQPRPYHVRSGTPLAGPSADYNGKSITAFSAALDGTNAVFGFSDGTVRFATLRFPTRIVPDGELPKGLRALDDRDSTDGSAVYSKIPGDQYRKTLFHLDLEEEVQASKQGHPIVRLGYRVSGQAERQVKAFVATGADGVTTLNLASSSVNLLTGARRISVEQMKLPALPKGTKVHSLLLTTKADQVLVADRSGVVHRYNTVDFKAPFLAETTRLLPQGADLRIFAFLLGGSSIVVGGSEGSLDIYFLLRDRTDKTRDGRLLERTRRFGPFSSAAVQFTPAFVGRSFAVGDQDGGLHVFHGTSQKKLIHVPGDGSSSPLERVVLAPRLDAMLAFEKGGRARYVEFSVPHPETSFTTVFRRVWYEGYAEPGYTWQSSASTEDYEPKLSLVPLIFGTVKAAFYSLLFAIPIAVLGAIYTSEFVSPKVRSVVKPTMEMMASLPSVVLGFVAALVMAPIVETWIAAILLAFLVVPLSLMGAAYAWQLIPLRTALLLQGVPKFVLTFLVVLASIGLALKMGPFFEMIFFQGDFKAWVNGDLGGPEPFLFLLGLPVCMVVVTMLVSRWWGRRVALMMVRLSRPLAALLDGGRWLAVFAASCLLSYGAAKLLALSGFDARGSFVGTYVQRNTLVVGFAMGFAVIPLIYTIAEDALNAVPEHLRAASLGCGATPWQTALYVVLPTAVSGVFSAIMIGMGRAVGETMIVVMSAGNTPIIDWNIFNGLRALSATIAVELPEAVRDGTLYRLLFLSGLVLFAMTFVINTVAEVVRMRFRKRATQL
jgi:phosphate transport system permease protein